ncbi:hypothetical protein POHY109586_24145 [Polaromonas hydrogenivorans]
MHEEFGWNDVQALAHVFTDTHHGLTASAGCVLWLVVVLHTFEVFWQGLTFGLAAGVMLGVCRVARILGSRLQCCKLCFQIRLVGRQRFFKQLALLGIHALGLGIKSPSLQAAQLKQDALDTRFLELDGLGLRVNLLALLANVLEDLGRQRCSGLRAQTDEVLSAEGVHVEHAVIVQKAHSDWN